MGEVDTMHQPLDGRVHRELIASMIERGRPPFIPELRETLHVSIPEILQALSRLEANHGYVPHPGTVDPWVIHPFSTTPTLFFVHNGSRGWWAPCIWCAFGIAHLVEGSATISSTLGGESHPIQIGFNGEVTGADGLVAHFPVPVAKAWDNVHRHCAATLVFDSEDAVDAWCERHGYARGEVVPLDQVADLARAWYGGHLDPDWVKFTASEAQERFTQVGLTAGHWQVPGADERF